MPIPQSRKELTHLIESTYLRLEQQIADLSDAEAGAVCVDDWTIKQVVAIRVWWSEQVVGWVEAGRRGELPDLPAPGFKWNETPSLNHAIAERATALTFPEVRDRLARAYEEVRSTIADLDDRELLDPGVFEWAGKWPVSRWFSINTARQYKTAGDYIRRVRRATS